MSSHELIPKNRNQSVSVLEAMQPSILFGELGSTVRLLFFLVDRGAHIENRCPGPLGRC